MLLFLCVINDTQIARENYSIKMKNNRLSH